MPKPVYAAVPERLTQQPSSSTGNCPHRAGVPVTQWGQTVPLSTMSTFATATPTTIANSSKNDVVMIDLDELPSPTKQVKESVQAQDSQSNFVDLVRMARNSFPSLSPEFIGFLLNQGNAIGNSQQNVRGNTRESVPDSQDSSVALSANTEDGDKNVESCDATSDSDTTENSETLRGLLAHNTAPQEIAEIPPSPTHPTVQNEEVAPDETVTSPTPPTEQEGTTSDSQQDKAEVSSSPSPR